MKWIESDWKSKSFYEGFQLSSGRTVYANCRIVGIDPEGDISGGYDNGISLGWEGAADPSDRPWTPEERRELAEEMIRLWADFGGFGIAREGPMPGPGIVIPDEARP